MQKTFCFDKNPPSILSASAIVGPKESIGPLGKYFKNHIYDDTFGEKTYEKAECKMQGFIIAGLLKENKLNSEDIDVIIAGDLLNQIISASFASREFDIPFLGVYNACSTLTESLTIASIMLDSAYINRAVCLTSSHFSTAERQYRYPLELGSTRPPQSQWTVTGAGGFLLGNAVKNLPKITMATIGKVVDYGVKDANNMGCAMAPAAVDTLLTHFKNTNTDESNYDLIVTGDLGILGSKVFCDMLNQKGVDITDKHVDCGGIIYKKDEQEFQGGSGAGCSAVVFADYFYPQILKKKYKKVIFMATGALLSTLSSQQGESIPSIAHLVVVENC